MGHMLFCPTIHELISSIASELKVFHLDDGTKGGDLEDLRADLRKSEDHGWAIGLTVNVHKSELISHGQSVVEVMISDFPGLKFTEP